MSTAENLHDLIQSLAGAYTKTIGEGRSSSSSLGVNIASVICGNDCAPCMIALVDGVENEDDLRELDSSQLAKLESFCPCDCGEQVVYQSSSLKSSSDLSEAEITQILNLSQTDFELGLDRDKVTELFNSSEFQTAVNTAILEVASVATQATGYFTQEQSVNAVCVALSTDNVIDGVKVINASYTESIQKIIKTSVQKTFDESKNFLIVLGSFTAVMGLVLAVLMWKHHT
jgi:hypothetical protein